jgi:hypothetical protein
MPWAAYSMALWVNALQDASRSQVQCDRDGAEDNKDHCPEQHMQQLFFNHFVVACQSRLLSIFLACQSTFRLGPKETVRPQWQVVARGDFDVTREGRF